MNVNEFITKLTNIQISLETEKEQIAFTNTEVKFKLMDVEDIVYENGCVELKFSKGS